MANAPIPALVLPEYRPYIKLIILKDVRDGDVVYTKGQTIEVFTHEANILLTTYPDSFTVG